MSKEIVLVIVILVSATVLIIGVLSIYTYNEIQRLNDEITKTKINEVTALSSRFALRLQYAVGIMELTGQTFPMNQPPIFSNLISDDLKGIPGDADSEKREMARKMLEKRLDLDYVFYAMPDGDIYFLEPFNSQLNLSQLNFAFRDWYKGATSTDSTYISEVYVSANEKHNVIAIAVPVHDEDGSLNGIFVGALNLGAVQRSLSQMNIGQNEYFLIIDHNNNIVIDSRKSESDIAIKRFTLDLDSLQQRDGLNLVTRTIDGNDITVAFKTTQVGNHEWSVISIQPYDDVFASSIALRNEVIIIAIIITAITSITGFFMIRKINTNIEISARLKHINSELEIKTEQIKHIDVQKEEFSAMITHELKTPLVPIIGYCKMLKNKMLGDLNKEQLESITTIETNAKRLESLISDIMDVRKLDLDKMKFNLEVISIDDLFDNLNASYKVLEEKGKAFTVNLPVRGLTIKTDKIRLRQVFDNLISNAIKFTPEINGKIEVGMKEDDNITFYVKDNGMGIPKDKQANLFKKFYQIDTSERRKAGGTGLGLAISKGIIDKLKGKIWVESDEKSGTTFYISLNKE